MAKGRKVTIPSDGQLDAAQGVLVPMSETELQEAGRTLATMVKTLRDLKTSHAGQRVAMKKEREETQKEIDRVARTIREQGR